MLAPEESAPRIYVPEGCKTDVGAQALEDAGLIKIVILEGVRAGALVEVSPVQAHVITITTNGRGGAVTDYDVEREHERRPGGETWRYRIRTADRTDFFESRFVAMGEAEVQSVMINLNGQVEFSARGIPEALFALVARDSGRTLVSSSNRADCTRLANEYRTKAATTVWRRLANAGRATYDPQTDRFTYRRG